MGPWSAGPKRGDLQLPVLGFNKITQSQGASCESSTFGFLTLDTVDEESVELGIAASIAVFDDRIVFGYGQNLQAEENEGFFFFSVRLLKINAPF